MPSTFRLPSIAFLAALALVACAPVQPPGGAAASQATAGWNAAALAEVVTYAQSQKSTGFLIMENRRVIAQHTWPLPDDAATFRTNFVHGTAPDGALLEDVASQQKSFVAVLVGVAIDKGLLDIEKPVSAYVGAGWSKASVDQEAAIRVRHLLEMNSGLSEKLEFVSPAGSKFFYNTPAYAILKPVLEKASGLSLDDITRTWLTQPAGMADTAWRARNSSFAGAGNPTGLVTTPQDVARLGQLVLDGGLAASGARVISKAQLDAMLAPTGANPSYARLWWLNGAPYSIGSGAGVRVEGPLIPSAPKDLVAAQGAQDRKLYISSGRDLIVVRFGQAAPDRDFNEQLWRRLAKAAPGG
ncbi:MAG: serine hydrolase [Alphaproteobacteria bacterium]|nr:serine hydrolase [Alphaproteobacteria bacterium]